MKKWQSLTLIVVFSMSLFGCQNVGQGQENEMSVEIMETFTENDSSNDKITFPTSYENTIENVDFRMDVIIDTDLEEPLVTAKAKMQKVNESQAFQLLFSNNDNYDTYNYEEKDEYGKEVNTGTYVSPEETTLSYGPLSSQMTYMQRDLMPYIRSSFVLDAADERYNANLYSTESQLSFMTRDEAFQIINNALVEMNIECKYDYTGYALDYNSMQSQEYHEDVDGNIDRAQYKNQWSGLDEGYYFCINQIYRGLPLYHVYCEIFSDVADANAPIQAFVSKDGIEYLEIEKVFEIFDEEVGIQLVPMDVIAETVANKYNQILGSSTYEITQAELYYYVDLSSGMGVYDIKPVWIVKGVEKNGQGQHGIQVIIDAHTAKEIIP
ncbi:MAG: hypothetical protein K2N73_06780 [Lachnospiraceae bacterium]|nr:hypothetical protein [Lachnospiraceae bacterium]